MKKKIVSVGVTVALAAVAFGGATLAYFTDKDAQTNVFTTGNVAIDLYEDFGSNTGSEKLVPATYAADGALQNGIEKEIYVTNDGSEDAYVRIHFAIPTILDDGDPNFNASKNTLHWNFWNYGDNQWNWTKDADDAGYDPAKWNFYTENINGVDYNVYVATYETALTNKQTTPNAVWRVYLDSKTTNEQITSINTVLDNNWQILVAAEGAQAEGFADAYTALNTAFGQPGQYDVDWTAVSGKTFEDVA